MKWLYFLMIIQAILLAWMVMVLHVILRMMQQQPLWIKLLQEWAKEG